MSYLNRIFYPRQVWVWHECADPTNSRAVPDGHVCPTCGRTETVAAIKVYDEYDMPPTLVNDDTFPELHEQWRAAMWRGRE